MHARAPAALPQAVAQHGFSSEEELSIFAESWLFREKQQCAFDGFFSPDDVSTVFPWEFETLEGPNMPVPGGLQVSISNGEGVWMGEGGGDQITRNKEGGIRRGELVEGGSGRKVGGGRIRGPRWVLRSTDHVPLLFLLVASFVSQAIAVSLSKPLDIRFGHKVTGVEWGDGGVCVSCSNGVELEADAVLMTVSSGVLQVRG
jgi:hypothetical protein